VVPERLNKSIQDLEMRVFQNIEESQQICDRAVRPTPSNCTQNVGNIKMLEEDNDFMQSVEI